MPVCQPVLPQNPAALGAVATIAALPLLGVDEVPFVVDGEVGAGGVHTRHHGGAEEVILAVVAIHPLPVVGGIVEHLPSVGEVGLVDGSVLDEGDLEGIWEEGRVLAQSSQNQ